MYRYGMKYRPVSPGAQPKGMVDWTEDTKYYAIISYERKLTQKELDDYELEEVRMPISEAKLRANHKYDAKAYDKYGIRFAKGELDVIRSACETTGESLNAFIVNAVRDKLNKLKEPTER